MPQIFHRSMNTISRVSLFGFVFFVGAAIWLTAVLARSPYATQEGVIMSQPIPFSHEHHVGGLGIDCRYCHTSVETSAVAGLPATAICRNCHSQIWNEAPLLEPVRSGAKLAWTRVHDLPDFAYFNHSIHIHKGIACVTCHGRVDRMPLMWKNETLFMEWCLDCHRNPERSVTRRENVFEMPTESQSHPLAPPAGTARRASGAPIATPIDQGRQLVEAYAIQQKTSCSICHR